MKSLMYPRDLRELQERLAGLTEADTRLWGRMSVPEMLCHCRGAFAIALGERPARPVKPQLPRPVIKWLALKAPMQWPRGVPTVPELLRGGGVPTPVDFTQDRAALVEKLVDFADRREIATSHAIFGAMNTSEWMRWGYLHTDHHLRQFGR